MHCSCLHILSVILPKLKQFDDLVRDILSAWTHPPPTGRYSPSPGLAIFYNTATTYSICFPVLLYYTPQCNMLCFVGTVVWSGSFIKTKPHPPTIFRSFTGCSIYYIIVLAKCVRKQGHASYYICTNVYSCVGVSVVTVTEQRSIDRSVIISGKVAVTVRTGSPYLGGPGIRRGSS